MGSPPFQFSQSIKSSYKLSKLSSSTASVFMGGGGIQPGPSILFETYCMSHCDESFTISER